MNITEHEMKAVFGDLDLEEMETAHTVADAIETVSRASGVPVVAILGHSRIRRVARARQLAMFKAHEAGLGISQIGRHMGRDHTTVEHGVKATKKRLVDTKAVTQELALGVLASLGQAFDADGASQ